MEADLQVRQSHNLTLYCGCVVYVSCHPTTHETHTRVIERRGACCRERFHHVGARLRACELLPRETVSRLAAAPDRRT